MGLFGGGGGGIGGGVGRVGGGGIRPGGMFSGGGAPGMGGSPIGGMFGGGMRGGGMPGMMPGMMQRPQIAQPGVRPQQAPRPQIAVPRQQNLPKAGQSVAPPVAPPPTPTMAPTPMVPSKGPTLNPPQPGRGFPTTPQPTPPMIAQPGAQSVGQLPPLTQGHHQMGKDQSQLTPTPQMTQRHGLGGRFGEGMYPGNGPSTVMQPQVAPFQPGKTGVMPTARTPVPVGPPPARPGMVPQQMPQVPPQAARPVPPAGPGMVPQPLPRGQGGLPPATKLQSVAPRTAPSVGPGMAQTASMPGISPLTQQAAQMKPMQAGLGSSPGMFGSLKQAKPGDVGAMPPPPTQAPGAPQAMKHGGFEKALMAQESGNNPKVVNSLGYAGSYQFGAPRLSDLGMYKAGKGERLSKSWGGNKWSGEFNVPGHPKVKTLDNFLNSPQAQQTAFNAHRKLMDREMVRYGLDKKIGTTLDGTKVTRAGLHGMMHLGGAGGAKKAFSGGNIRDAYNTGVMDYHHMFARY